MQPRTHTWLVCTAIALCTFAMTSRAQPASADATLYLLENPSGGDQPSYIITLQDVVPGTFAPVTKSVPITGLNTNEHILKITMRPATGEVVGVTGTGRLMNIDPRSGQTTFLSQLSVMPTAWNVFSFHPTTDRLRIMRASGENWSVVPDTGVATAETAHSIVSFRTGAYAPDGSLYALAGQTLYRFADPSTGLATAIGPTTAPDNGYGLAFAPDGTGFFLNQFVIISVHTVLRTLSIPDGNASQNGQLPGQSGYSGIAIAGPGRVRFSAPDYSTLESAGSGLITLRREAGSTGPFSVKLSAAPGTATDPGDFTGFNSTIEFVDGEVSKTLAVPIVNDTADEGDETVTLTLTDPTLGATLGHIAAATLTIVDNDPVIGAAPAIEITAPTADPAYTGASLFITLAGTAADTDGAVTSVTYASDRGPTGTASIGAAAASLEWFATDVQLDPGVNTITVTATDNAGNVATDTIVVTVNELSHYLAEGATGTFFDLDLLLANPNAMPVNVTATFLKPLGQGTVEQYYTLPPRSRTTIEVDAIPGLERTEVSTIVTVPSARPIVVERTMRWNDTGYGAHTDKASQSTSTKWYFAEGSQGFFFTYLLLANPHNAANRATVKYLRENASTVTRQYDLDPLERFTVDVGADTELANQSFGMEVSFTLPGIAERAMYFGVSPFWVGGHESVGVTLPSRSWFLAEGATGPFFETFVLFANPTATTAEVNVRYLPASGAPVARSYAVPAGERLTVNIEGQDATLANAAVATEVTSNVPIIVERAQYWPDPAPNWYEAHNSFGVTATSTRWAIAEGRVGLAGNYQTYILLANPNTDPSDVTITFLRENGTTLSKTFTVQPGNRFNVAVGGVDTPEILNERFGAAIVSTLPIVVERAMYSDLNGVTWQAGTNATATRMP